jgi:molecular chaperone GrpE
MPDEKGVFTADIPASAVAAAVAAVEKGRAPAEPGGEQVATPDAESPRRQEAPPDGAEAALDEIDELRAELEMSQEGSRKLYEQLREEHDRLLRTAADLENYKKRAARERDEIQRYGNERLVKEILPVLDALDRALAAAPAGDQLAGGVEMTRRLLEEALARFGVKAFSAKGERFDPRVHEALMSMATSEYLPGMVVEEQQRGFFLHDRLIRPAAVVVSAAPAVVTEAEAEADGEADGEAPPSRGDNG